MFIYDILKETFRLFFEMAPYLMLGLGFVALMNLFFTKDIIIKYVGKDNIWSVIKASMFGVPLPLCSCGVIPSTVYLSKNGASKGAVISFLISTPQTGIDSMIATYGMMGWIFAIYRPVVALIMGVIGGIIVRFVKTENKPDSDLSEIIDKKDKKYLFPDEKKDIFFVRLKKMLKYAFVEFLDDISMQFVVGLFISGIISYMIPDGFFSGSSIQNGILGMLIMMAVGIPMYVCATASIPIAVTLMLKGLSPGVAFVFLVTGPATNAASLSIIFNTLGKRVGITYLTVIAVCSIIFGYLLNYVFELAKVNPVAMFQQIHQHHHETVGNDWLYTIVSFIFLALIAASLIRKSNILKYFKKDRTLDTSVQKINISGMTCNHCVMNVKSTISKIDGVTKVDVSLPDNAAFVEGNFDMANITKAIEDIGYKVG